MFFCHSPLAQRFTRGPLRLYAGFVCAPLARDDIGLGLAEFCFEIFVPDLHHDLASDNRIALVDWKNCHLARCGGRHLGARTRFNSAHPRIRHGRANITERDGMQQYGEGLGSGEVPAAEGETGNHEQQE